MNEISNDTPLSKMTLGELKEALGITGIQIGIGTIQYLLGKEAAKSNYDKIKETKDIAIYNDWNDMISKPGAKATAVCKVLQEKYGVGINRIYNARKRVQEQSAKH